jgi:hypothetical protein
MKVIPRGDDSSLITREIEHLKNLKSEFVIQYFETFGSITTYIITELCPVTISTTIIISIKCIFI